MRLVILAALLATMSLASTVDRVVPDSLADSVLLEVVGESATDEPAATPTEAPSHAPTEEPSTCEDKTLEDGEEWHDSSGNEYDCSWYSNGDNCQLYGDQYENANYTANEACCACGGGSTYAEPTVAPTNSTEAVCEDYPYTNGTEWHDLRGEDFNCEWYAVEYDCETSGDEYEYEANYTANEACCACGGGSTSSEIAHITATETPTKAPTDAPTDAQCQDYTTTNGTNWHDSGGQDYDCDWYSATGDDSYGDDHCESYGDSYEYDGYTANEACCTCGGGTTNGTTGSDSGSGSGSDEYGSGDNNDGQSDQATEDEPTHAPTNADCEDSTTSNGTAWHDSGGDEFSCDWYAFNNGTCVSYGDGYEYDGQTASEACCACGGGQSASTPAPTNHPTISPTSPPSSPTLSPTDTPTRVPTDAPTDTPTDALTNVPTSAPTGAQTDAPTSAPTSAPTTTIRPTHAPTEAPTDTPTHAPTEAPTDAPTIKPTIAPTEAQTGAPTNAPTDGHTAQPTEAPSLS